MERPIVRAELRPWVTQSELVDDDVVDWLAFWWNDCPTLPAFSFLF